MPARLTPLQGLFALIFIFIAGFLWHWVTTPLAISVTGMGSVEVMAEKATFEVVVSTVDEDVTHAAIQVREKVATIRSLLVNEGITADQVSESQLQITPAGALVAGATGSQVIAVLTVETPYVSTVGELVVYLYQNGATLVSQPVVSAANQEDLENQALKEALKEADAQAKSLGYSKWKFFRRAISITQASSGVAAVNTKSGVEDGMGAVSQGNTFEVTKAVSVVYELR